MSTEGCLPVDTGLPVTLSCGEFTTGGQGCQSFCKFRDSAFEEPIHSLMIESDSDSDTSKKFVDFSLRLV